MEAINRKIVYTARKYFPSFARVAIFIIFFWFGILKVLDVSPASPMVLELLRLTMPFMEPGLFLILFGAFEMFIGILFLFPIFTRFAILLLGLHMITTTLPLIVMPSWAWQDIFVPTMEGQYIIKNILIVALGIGIAGNEPSQR